MSKDWGRQDIYFPKEKRVSILFNPENNLENLIFLFRFYIKYVTCRESRYVPQSTHSLNSMEFFMHLRKIVRLLLIIHQFILSSQKPITRGKERIYPETKCDLNKKESKQGNMQIFQFKMNSVKEVKKRRIIEISWDVWGSGEVFT